MNKTSALLGVGVLFFIRKGVKNLRIRGGASCGWWVCFYWLGVGFVGGTFGFWGAKLWGWKCRVESVILKIKLLF
jgi:hypothetical protein